MSSKNSTESYIESAIKDSDKTIILNPLYLHDEHLPEEEKRLVLQEVFNRNIREKQIGRVVKHLTPIFQGTIPPAALIYGPTGTGKTVTLIHVLSSFEKVASKKGVPFRFAYVDLTTPKTVFGAFNELAMAVDPSIRRYRKGMPTEFMQAAIIDALNKENGFLCLLVDEVDNIQPRPDDLLTFLAKTLPRKITCRLVLVLLTNRLEWERNLDPRIMSCLKKNDLLFEPYDAADLLAILKLRVEKALRPDRVEEAALRKVAAYASKETGDARKAVSLLARAAELAQETTGRLTEREIDDARELIEVNKSEELIQALATQQYLALMACYVSFQKGARKTSTGEAYQVYRSICDREMTRPLTQRRFSDMIGFLDLYGLVSARMRTLGRYGNTREISGSLPPDVVQRFLKSRN